MKLQRMASVSISMGVGLMGAVWVPTLGCSGVSAEESALESDDALGRHRRDSGATDSGTGATDAGTDAATDGGGATVLDGGFVWPDITNTGAPTGTTFTVHDGDLELRTAGQIVDAVHVRGGTVLCEAANITIRNAKITGGGILAFPSCTGLRVDGVEVDCENAVGSSGFSQDNGVVGQDIEIRHVNSHRCENGIFIDNGVHVYDSWIHEPIAPGDTFTGAHSDGIQLWAGASDVVIQDNVIDYRGDTTSAIITGCSSADACGMKIHHNKLAGGAYTLYLPNERGPLGQPLTNVAVTDNRFGQNAFAFGYCTGWTSELAQWSGNVVDETGATLASCD